MVRTIGYLSALLLISATVAHAQQAAPTAQEQIERAIGSLFVSNANLQAQLVAAQAQIADLKKQLEAKKPEQK